MLIPDLCARRLPVAALWLLAGTACGRVRTEDFSFRVGDAWIAECPDGVGAFLFAHSSARSEACLGDLPDGYERTDFEDCGEVNNAMEAVFDDDGSCGAMFSPGWRGGLMALFSADDLTVEDGVVLQGTSSGVMAISCNDETGEFDIGSWSWGGGPGFEAGNAAFERNNGRARVNLSGHTDIIGQIAVEGRFGATYCDLDDE